MMAGAERLGWRQRPGFYVGMMLASFGAIAGLKMGGFLSFPAGYILFFLAMLWMFPVVRTGMEKQKRCGMLSPAVVRYNRRFMIASFGYMLGLGTAISLNERFDLTGVIAFAVALLPVIPTLGMVWTMGRYLVEEQDEYLRHRAMIANIAGLGAVLSIGCFYGFLETFGLVPHLWAWWVVPLWAIGMGAGQAFMALRNRDRVEG